MRIHYLQNRGIAVEAINCSVLVNYTKGKLPLFRPEKPIYVLVTSFKSFSPRIFTLAEEYDDVYFFLPQKISGKQIPDEVRKQCSGFYPSRSYDLARLKLSTAAEQDGDISFTLTTGSFSMLYGTPAKPFGRKRYTALFFEDDDLAEKVLKTCSADHLFKVGYDKAPDWDALSLRFGEKLMKSTRKRNMVWEID